MSLVMKEWKKFLEREEQSVSDKKLFSEIFFDTYFENIDKSMAIEHSIKNKRFVSFLNEDFYNACSAVLYQILNPKKKMLSESKMIRVSESLCKTAKSILILEEEGEESKGFFSKAWSGLKSVGSSLMAQIRSLLYSPIEFINKHVQSLSKKREQIRATIENPNSNSLKILGAYLKSPFLTLLETALSMAEKVLTFISKFDWAIKIVNWLFVKMVKLFTILSSVVMGIIIASFTLTMGLAGAALFSLRDIKFALRFISSFGKRAFYGPFSDAWKTSVLGAHIIKNSFALGNLVESYINNVSRGDDISEEEHKRMIEIWKQKMDETEVDLLKLEARQGAAGRFGRGETNPEKNPKLKDELEKIDAMFAGA